MPGSKLQDPYNNKPVVFDVKPRTGPSVTFALSPYSEGFSKFYINETSGEITVIPGLDREEKDTYSVSRSLVVDTSCGFNSSLDMFYLVSLIKFIPEIVLARKRVEY